MMAPSCSYKHIGCTVQMRKMNGTMWHVIWGAVAKGNRGAHAFRPRTRPTPRPRGSAPAHPAIPYLGPFITKSHLQANVKLNFFLDIEDKSLPTINLVLKIWLGSCILLCIKYIFFLISSMFKTMLFDGILMKLNRDNIGT